MMLKAEFKCYDIIAKQLSRVETLIRSYYGSGLELMLDLVDLHNSLLELEANVSEGASFAPIVVKFRS